jgi:hypothetical protein
VVKINKGPSRVTKHNVGRHLAEYFNAKSLADKATERVRKQRDLLIDYAEEAGVEDDKGHRWVEVPGVGTIKRERRVSVSFDSVFAEAWLRSKDMYDECTVTVVELDEDVVLGKLYEGDIPEDVGQSMYPTKEQFSLRVQELDSD